MRYTDPFSGIEIKAEVPFETDDSARTSFLVALHLRARLIDPVEEGHITVRAMTILGETIFIGIIDFTDGRFATYIGADGDTLFVRIADGIDDQYIEALARDYAFDCTPEEAHGQ